MGLHMIMLVDAHMQTEHTCLAWPNYIEQVHTVGTHGMCMCHTHMRVPMHMHTHMHTQMHTYTHMHTMGMYGHKPAG